MQQHTIPRRKALQLGLAASAACVWPQARACEFFSTTLRIIHPWTRAAEADAGAVTVCMGFDGVRQADRLIGVQTPVAARAQMGGGPVDFAIAQDQESALTESGATLQLLELTQPLEVGCEYPMQLTFEKGGTVNAKLTIAYARFR